MPDYLPDPQANIKISTLDRSEIGLATRRRVTSISNDDKQLETPSKAIPADKLYHENQISDEARGANEFYAQVSTARLSEDRDNERAAQHRGLEEQLRWSRDNEFDFTFLEYTDAHQISRMEAYQLVGILSEYSDFLTVPCQKKIYSNIDAENGIDDSWYKLLRNGTELFLQACHDADTEQPIMGAIPPLELEHLEDLIELYELYDVYSFYIDYNWDYHPTKPNQVARLRYVMRRIRSQRIHDDVLFYGLNSRRGDFDDALGFTPAADFATVMMGVDIIGGNHSTPDWPKEVFEQIERNDDVQVFRPEIMGYIQSPVDRLHKNVPDESTIDIETMAEESATSYTTRNRYQKILNAEVQSLDLLELRNALDEGISADYLDARHIAEEFIGAYERVRDAFDEGEQTQVDEWT